MSIRHYIVSDRDDCEAVAEMISWHKR